MRNLKQVTELIASANFKTREGALYLTGTHAELIRHRDTLKELGVRAIVRRMYGHGFPEAHLDVSGRNKEEKATKKLLIHYLKIRELIKRDYGKDEIPSTNELHEIARLAITHELETPKKR